MARTTAVAIEIRTKELARRLLWGQPHSEIMAELGLTYQQFRNATTSPQFRAELEQLQRQAYTELDNRFREEMETVQSRARRESLNAVDILISLMKGSASESLKRDCAKDVIELAGESEASKRPVIHINQATINLMKQAKDEDDARVIDITAKPIAD